MPIKASILSGNFIIDIDYLKELEETLKQLKEGNSQLRGVILLQERKQKKGYGKLFADFISLQREIEILKRRIETLERKGFWKKVKEFWNRIIFWR